MAARVRSEIDPRIIRPGKTGLSGLQIFYFFSAAVLEMSKVGDNSVADGGEPKEPFELELPNFAEDLAPNVKAGFDSTC